MTAFSTLILGSFAAVVAHAMPLRSADGQTATPLMGYNSYNDVSCSPNSTWMEATMHAMAMKKLIDAGYVYFQIDCGWQGFERLPNGSITYDPEPFPDGIQPLSDLAHSLGMKWGLYTDQGVYACDTIQLPNQLRPGSLGYEVEDAAMMAAWGTDYVKVDNCYIEPPENAPKDPRTDFVTRFTAFWDALQLYNIPNMLICQWGTPYINPEGNLEGPSTWTPPISTSYRMSDDIASGWQNVMRIVDEAIHINLKDRNGPGNFADMDLLEVGNKGMTVTEQGSHFAIWAVFKSALMISTDVPNMSEEILEILSNKEIIAINQDPLAKPVKLVQRFSNDYDLYAGPLANGDQVVLALDTSNTTRTLTIDFADLGIVTADIQDLWEGTTTSAMQTFSADVQAHGTIVLRLSNAKAAAPATTVYTRYAASDGGLSGNSSLLPCAGCESGSKVGYISANDTSSSLTISNIRTTQETQDVKFEYINCEIGYTFADKGPNVRGANVSVNGGDPVEVLFPVTGYDWQRDLLDGFLVRLSGFNTNANNEIRITGSRYEPATDDSFGLSGWTPDFDAISIVS